MKINGIDLDADNVEQTKFASNYNFLMFPPLYHPVVLFHSCDRA